MQAILVQEDLPKMLVVNPDIEKTPWNKYFRKPFKTGELVRVNPEQLPAKSCKMTKESFRRNYVSVIRKDENGEWNLTYTLSWKYFNKIGKK